MNITLHTHVDIVYRITYVPIYYTYILYKAMSSDYRLPLAKPAMVLVPSVSDADVVLLLLM